MTDEKVFNQMNCFAVNGSQDSPIDVQPILPDLSGFELKGNEKIHDCDCQKWQKEEEIGHKLNKYTIWLKVENDVAIPKHYEMKGFNTLLGSHYDHYFLKYMVSECVPHYIIRYIDSSPIILYYLIYLKSFFKKSLFIFFKKINSIPEF